MYDQSDGVSSATGLDQSVIPELIQRTYSRRPENSSFNTEEPPHLVLPDKGASDQQEGLVYDWYRWAWAWRYHRDLVKVIDAAVAEAVRKNWENSTAVHRFKSYGAVEEQVNNLGTECEIQICWRSNVRHVWGLGLWYGLALAPLVLGCPEDIVGWYRSVPGSAILLCSLDSLGYFVARKPFLDFLLLDSYLELSTLRNFSDSRDNYPIPKTVGLTEVSC